MKKVLILQPESHDGCTWYRLKQFALEARKQGLIDVQFLNLSMPFEQLADVIDRADGYILRLSDTPSHEVFDQFDWDKIDKPIFLDIDDNYEIVDPLSDMYVVYGTEEVELPDGTPLWKDGANFNIEKNLERLDKYRKVLRSATAVFVTTFELKTYANTYNDNVVVIPNAINSQIFPEVVDPHKSKEIRLMWSGGASHWPDLIEIKEPLTRLMNKNPQLHFHILGVPFKGIVKDLPGGRVHTNDWIKADGHGYRLSTIDADIGICPLKEMEFNKYKSSVKYYEYASLGIATVAKNMPPYSDDIVDGQTGLLYSTPEEFEAKVQELIDDPIRRMEIGNAGREYVLKNRTVPSIAKDWAEFMTGVIDLYSTPKADPTRLSVVHHVDFSMGRLEGKNGIGVMQQGLKELSKLEIRHWLSSGTLIGLYRDKKLIPHDTDIDVNVLMDEEDPMEIELPGFELLRTMRYDGLLMQSAFRKEDVIFDIYYYYTGFKQGVALNYNEHGFIEKPLKFINTLSTLKLNGQEYPVPSHTEEFLEWRFGKDWKTPKTSKQSWEKDATHITPW